MELNTKHLRYKELDSLRGFAAVFVVLFHLTTHTPYSNPIIELGVTGVDLFFIISGFVIFMSINSIKTAKEFIVNRFAKLFPTYWFAVTFTSLLIIIYTIYKGNEIHLALKYLTNMTMFQHYFHTGNIDGTYWTMIIEMVFYIFIIILFQLKLLEKIIPISLVFLGVIVVWDYYIESHSPFIYSALRYICPLLNHYPLFFAGILFYKISTSTTSKTNFYFLLLLCVPLQIILYNNGGSAHNYITQLNYAIMLVFYFIVFTLFVNNKLTFIINQPALFMGKISYALYLIHQHLCIDFIIPGLMHKLNLHYLLAALVAFIVSIVLATFITFYIEIPFGKKIKLYLKK